MVMGMIMVAALFAGPFSSMLSGMGIGWDCPGMLLWLPAVILPFIIARMILASSRTVRWAPIEIVARAARRAGLSKGGFSLPLVLLRSLMLFLAVTATARPFVGARDSTGGLVARPTERKVETVVAGSRAAGMRRIILVEPAILAEPTAGSAVAATPDAAVAPSALRLAIKAICESGGFSAADDDSGSVSSRRLVPAVDAVAGRNLAAVLAGGPDQQPAAPGTLIILADGGMPIDFAATDAAAKALARAVDRGAALLVLVGTQTVAGPAERKLSDWLEPLAGVEIDGRANGAGQRIAVGPTLADVARDRSTPDAFVTLPGPSLAAFAALGKTPRAGQPAATVLAHTVPGGKPLLVESRVGAGTICVSALPLTLGGPDAWSDLTAWPVFVPLVDRLVTRLLDGHPEHGSSFDPDGELPRSSAGSFRFLEPLVRRLPPARLLLAIAVVLAMLDPLFSWLFSRQRVRGPSDHGPGSLQWLARIAIIGTLLAMFVGSAPETRPGGDEANRPRVAFLIDVSPSMATADAGSPADAPRRRTRLQAVLDQLAQTLSASRTFSSFPVSFFTVARDVTSIDATELRTDTGIATLPSGPQASRLGDAVEETVLAGRDRWSAIAIASDGMITAGATWEHASHIARAHGVPLLAIPVGGNGAAAAIDDPSGQTTIMAARLPRIAWRGEQVAVHVEAEAPAPVDQVPVVIATRDGRMLAEGMVLPQPRQTQPSSAGTVGRMPVRLVGQLSWTPADTGPQTLVVRAGRAKAGAGATDSADAAALAGALVGTTLVVDEPVPLLLVDAKPRFEFRFLEHLLSADRRFRVESCLFDALTRGRTTAEDGGTPARLKTPLPKTAAEWSRFDAVVLGDVLGDDFPNAAAAGLLEATRADGLGIAWAPGRRWETAGTTAGPFTDLLPATPAKPGSDGGPPDDTAWRLRLLPAGWQTGWFPGSIEPAARGAGTSNSALETFGGPAAVRLRPTARVLAVALPKQGTPAVPAIVLDQNGDGRVLGHLFATWRLRGGVGGGSYADYWRHAIARLAEGRILARHVPATLDIRPLRPAAGDRVRIDVVPTRPTADRAGWQMTHAHPDGREERLDASRETIRLDHLEPGWHTVALTASVATDAVSALEDQYPQHGKVSVEFFVPAPADERPGPPATPTAMEAAAVASGGSVVPLAEVAALPGLIERLAAARVETSTQWIHGLPTANVLMLALLASCAIEWAQRARRGMP